MSTHHSLWSRLGAIALVLSAVASSSCAARTVATESSPFRSGLEPMLMFENSATEPVTLYLADQTAEWPIGRVEPGRTAVLRLPTVVATVSDRQFWIVAVRSGHRRSSAAGTVSSTSPIRSLPFPGGNLTAVRWRLTNQQLVSLPLPRITRRQARR